jgi:hypothetical protein
LPNNDVGIGWKLHANRLDLDHNWASARANRIPLCFYSAKMYCFCTAGMPIRAILAISEDVICAMGESL